VGIGIVLAIVIAVFAYVAGYLTPRRLSASRIVDALEATGGRPHEGFAERTRKVSDLAIWIVERRDDLSGVQAPRSLPRLRRRLSTIAEPSDPTELPLACLWR
jgi:hypothetical protein